VRVRRATITDAGGIAVLVARYWEFEQIEGFDFARIERLLRTLLSNPQQGACWVAELDGRLSGYLLAVILFSLEHGGMMAEIDEVFVTAAARSGGVGSLLLAAAERDLAASGVVRVQLQLGVANTRGREFYERHGFRRRPGYELYDKPVEPENGGVS
jgi:GNAT superfamily N-acetyltransferase